MVKIAGFKGYKRTITLAFDYDEVKKGIPDVNKQFAVLNARQKESMAVANNSDKAIDKLGAKYDYLTNLIKIQTQQLDVYKQRLDTVNKAGGDNAKAVQNLSTSLEIAESRLGRTRAELDKVTEELKKQQGALGLTSQEWGKVGEFGAKGTKMITVPLIAMGTAMFKVGADMEDTIGKANVVFKDSSEEIQAWADGALENFGLASKTALSMATDFSGGFQQLGISMKKSKEWSTNLTSLVSDLSAYYNSSLSETQYALTAILSGQTEPLKRFQIFMTEANLQQFAYEKGMQSNIRTMTEAEKVQLRYNYVMEKTKMAHGQLNREQDSATAQLNKFKEGLIQLGVDFGKHVLPYATPLLEFMNGLIAGFSKLDDGTKKFIVTIGGVIAIAMPVIMVVGKVFESINNISEGMGTVGKGLKKAGEIGSKFGDKLTSSGFFGFAKWALIIGGVAVAIGFVVSAINDFLGKQNSFAKSLGDISNIVGGIQNTKMRGYDVGTNRLSNDQVAMVHKDEAIIPAKSNPWNPNATTPFQFSQGSGDTFHLNVKMEEISDVNKLINIFNEIQQTRRAGVV